MRRPSLSLLALVGALSLIAPQQAPASPPSDAAAYLKRILGDLGPFEQPSAAAERMLLIRGGFLPSLPGDLTPGLRPADQGTGDVQVNDPADDTGNSTTQSETSLAVRGTTVCGGWNEFSTGGLSGYGRSTDRGNTWTDLDGIGASGDPVIAVDQGTGRFYYAEIGNANAIGVARSDDDCQTFGAAVDAAAQSSGLATTNFNDKPWVAVDNTGGANDGNVYVCWTRFIDADTNGTVDGSELRFSRSTDGGTTYVNEQVLQATGTAPFGCNVQVSPNGQVNVAWADRAGATVNDIRFRSSGDGGQTFIATTTVATGNRHPGTDTQVTCGPGTRPTLTGNIRMLHQAWMAVDSTGGANNGSIYVTWGTDPAGTPDNSDVMFSRSTNGGGAWSAAVQLGAGGGNTDQWNPNVAVGGTGQLAVGWYDRRNDTAGNTNFDVYTAFSQDGGANFGALQRVTDVSSGVPQLNPTFNPGQAQCYMGEYIGVAADATRAYYLWGDNRNTITNAQWPSGRPDPDVFFDRFALPGANQSPTANAGGPYTTPEGTDASLNGAGSSDPDPGDTLTYEWDFDYDGVTFTVDATGPVVAFDRVGRDRGWDIALRVTDSGGESDIDTTTVTVTNVAPSVSLGTNAPKDEGSTVQVTGTITDPGWLDPLAGTIEWMDGSPVEPVTPVAEEHLRPNGTLQFEASHIYGDDGNYSVQVCGSDDDTATCQTIGVQIDNVAPIVTFDPAPDTTLDEFDTSDVRVTFTDPGWLDTYSAQVTWGEGTTDNPAAVVTTQGNPGPDMGEAMASHQYGDNGMYGVTFSVTDDDGGSGAAGFTADVANVDPTADIDSSSAIIVNGMETIIAHAGQNVPFTAESKDPGSDDLRTTWDWDDGAPAPDHVTSSLVNPPFPDGPFPPGSPTVEPRDIDDAKDHTFGDACLYDVAFTSADDDDPAGGSSDGIPVIILGNAERSRSYGWWHPQFKENGNKADFDQATLECYLAITRFGSDVFDEERPLTTLEDAHAIFHKDDALSSHQEKLDKVLLAAWLNWANGAFDWFQPVVDTNKDKIPDLSFAVAVVNAETVRLNPLSTKDDLEGQKKIMDRFNHYKP